MMDKPAISDTSPLLADTASSSKTGMISSDKITRATSDVHHSSQSTSGSQDRQLQGRVEQYSNNSPGKQKTIHRHKELANLDACQHELDTLIDLVNSLKKTRLSNEVFNKIATTYQIASELNSINHQIISELEGQLLQDHDYQNAAKEIHHDFIELMKKHVHFHKALQTLLPALQNKHTTLYKLNQPLEDQKAALVSAIEIYLQRENETENRIENLSRIAFPIFLNDRTLKVVKSTLNKHFTNQYLLAKEYAAILGSTNFSVKDRAENLIVEFSGKKVLASDLCILIPRQMAQTQLLLKEISKKMARQADWKKEKNLPHPLESKMTAMFDELTLILDKEQQKLDQIIS